MTKNFLVSFFIYLSHLLFILSQKILNLIFKLFSSHYYPNLKKIQNHKKNKKKIIYEANSLVDAQLVHYVTAKSFNSMGFDNILFYNMTINSLYNPKTFFFMKN